jgi:hypothetical protein
VAVDLSGLRDAIENIAAKIDTLRSVVVTLQEGQVVQGAVDDLKARVDEISNDLDELIASAQPEEPAEPAPV